MAKYRERFVPIIRREHYDAFRAVIPGDDLPPTFDEWSKLSEQQIAQLEARGEIANKVEIDPDEFAIYCRRSGLDCNSYTLGAFTIVAANKRQ